MATILSPSQENQKLVFAAESNLEILLRALKECGRTDNKGLYDFLWKPENRDRFARHGRAWARDRVEHDMHYLCKSGRVWMVRDAPNHFSYYLSPEELWL